MASLFRLSQNLAVLRLLGSLFGGLGGRRRGEESLCPRDVIMVDLLTQVPYSPDAQWAGFQSGYSDSLGLCQQCRHEHDCSIFLLGE